MAGITSGDGPQQSPDINIYPSSPSRPTVTLPLPSASPPPDTSSAPTSPSPSPSPSPTPTTTPEVSGQNSMPQETGYIIAAATVAVALVALLTVVHKKRNSEK